MTQKQEVVRTMSGVGALFMFFFMGFAMVLGILMGYCMLPLTGPKILINSHECQAYNPIIQNNLFVKVEVADGYSFYLCKEPKVQEIGEVSLDK